MKINTVSRAFAKRRGAQIRLEPRGILAEESGFSFEFGGGLVSHVLYYSFRLRKKEKKDAGHRTSHKRENPALYLGNSSIIMYLRTSESESQESTTPNHRSRSHRAVGLIEKRCEAR